DDATRKDVSIATGKRGRGRPRAGTRDWKRAFLNHLSIRGNVARACRFAGVHRTAAYKARQQDGEFELAWAIAMRTAGDLLEEEAWRRAVEGVDRATVSAGVIAYWKEYSDSLLSLLLRAAKPEKYRTKEPPGRVPLTYELARSMNLEQLNLVAQGVPVAIVL